MSIFTHKSDVWSLGILCWEIVTLGKSMFQLPPAASQLSVNKVTQCDEVKGREGKGWVRVDRDERERERDCFINLLEREREREKERVSVSQLVN